MCEQTVNWQRATMISCCQTVWTVAIAVMLSCVDIWSVYRLRYYL